MTKKALFIINPISGRKHKHDAKAIIEKYLKNGLFEPAFVYTEYAGHAYKIAKEASEKGIDYVFAVGGDGTVNEVSKALIGSDTIMGILPRGSGNGLARFLKISVLLPKAVLHLTDYRLINMDTLKINKFYSVNISGVGFDAHISHLFAKTKKRGPINYVKLVLQEYSKYKPVVYKLKSKGKRYKEKAFLISFANASQFGNNAHIAPNADITDGLIDLCILKQFPVNKAVDIAYKLYSKNLLRSDYFKVIKLKKIRLKSKTDLLGHIDGEPVNFGKKLHVKIKPASLKILSNR